MGPHTRSSWWHIIWCPLVSQKVDVNKRMLIIAVNDKLCHSISRLHKKNECLFPAGVDMSVARPLCSCHCFFVLRKEMCPCLLLPHKEWDNCRCCPWKKLPGVKRTSQCLSSKMTYKTTLTLLTSQALMCSTTKIGRDYLYADGKYNSYSIHRKFILMDWLPNLTTKYFNLHPCKQGSLEISLKCNAPFIAHTGN